jgi:hypothetical protein
MGLATNNYYLSTYFSYFQLNIIDMTNQRLLLGSGAGKCINNADCLPGYMCNGGACNQGNNYIF